MTERVVVEAEEAPSRDAIEVAPRVWLCQGETAKAQAAAPGRIQSEVARRRVRSAPDHPATKIGRTILCTTPAGGYPLELLDDGTVREVDDEGQPIGAGEPVAVGELAEEVPRGGP